MSEKTSLTKTINTVKGLFSSSSKSLFGIDIGSSSVKVAEIEAKWGKKPKLTLLRYGHANLPEGAIIEDEIQKPDEIKAAITEALEDSGISLNSCTLGLFGPNTVAKKLQLAGGTYEEIEDQVMWESEQYLPFSIDESTIDFHIIGENEGGGVDVIVAAVKDDVKNNYHDLLESAGLQTKVFDLNTIAMTNIFEVIHESKGGNSNDESYLLLDIGAQTTTFTIYRRGAIQFSKEITSGGMMITEEIQRRMGLNFYEAEDLKSNQDDNGNLPEEIVEIVDDIIEILFGEIKKTLDFYIVSTSDESLVACYITGGGTLCSGIQGGLEELLGVRVSLLNPLDVVEVNEKKFSEEKIHNITFRGCAVLGLALREL